MDRHVRLQSGSYRHAADDHRSTGAALKATIDFYPVAANPGVTKGSYELVGSYSAAKGLVLNPDYWVDEPAGYEMVGLARRPRTQTR